MSGLKIESLPEGWVKANLGDLCAHPQYGWTTSSKKEGPGVQLLRTTDISSGHPDWENVPYCAEEPENLTKYQLEPGDIVISRAGSVGISCLIKAAPKAVFASYLIRLRTLPGVGPDFVALFLKTPAYWSAVADNQSGIAVQNINATKLSALSLAFPPLAEQRRIICAVERILEKVSTAYERLERVPTTLKRFRQAVLTAACSGRLTADWRMGNQSGDSALRLLQQMSRERKEMWLSRNPNRKYRPPDDMEGDDLPEIPASWAWTNFDHCAWEITVGHVGPMKNRYVSDGIPFLRSQNVRPLRFDENGLVFIDSVFNKQLRKSALSGGEILVTRSGANTGDCCVYPVHLGHANCADLVITRPLSGLLSQYGAIYISSPDGQERIGLRETGMAQPHFNIGAMRVKPFPLPPLAEQREIVLRVSALLNLANTIEQRAKSALRRVEMLTHAILAKAFKGELVPTEAELARRENRSYEPASDLLARLKSSVNGETKRPRTRKPSKRATGSDENLLEFMES